MGNAVFAVIGAMIGAGFASGREIMSFFSRYGAWSWLLILWNAGWTMALMAFLMYRADREDGFFTGRAGKTWTAVLLTFAAGGMTAAAGDLAALTVPISGVRPWGGFLTLLLCLLLSKSALKAAAALAYLLIPALAIALGACLRIGGVSTAAVSRESVPMAFVRAAGYACFNVTLSLGVLLDAGKGKSRGQRKRAVLTAGIVWLAMTALGNAALLPYAEKMDRAALPTVLLLRVFGKTGYFMAAALLYLAAASTLIAALRGMRALLPGRYGLFLCGLSALAASRLGFRDIVEAAYPALGLISMAVLFFSRNSDQNKILSNKSHSGNV